MDVGDTGVWNLDMITGSTKDVKCYVGTWIELTLDILITQTIFPKEIKYVKQPFLKYHLYLYFYIVQL